MFLLALILSLIMTQNEIIFDFSKETQISQWQNVDDAVMGGVSRGNISLTPEGHGHFSGNISLENNGGFSSVRYRFSKKHTENYATFKLRVKGDGKRYQLRVKSSASDRHAYVFYFHTTGAWETIEVPFTQMHASFRGVRQNLPNFEGVQMEEISLLFASKENETFSLLIDFIKIE